MPLGRFFVESLDDFTRAFCREGKFPTVRMRDLQTPSALEWTVKGVRGSAPPKCIIKELPGPEGQKLETLHTLSALGERLGVPYGGSGEGVFVTECIRHLLRCSRVPSDIEKTCCAWCGETENLHKDHDPPQGRNTQPSPVQVLCEECHAQKNCRRSLL